MSKFVDLSALVEQEQKEEAGSWFPVTLTTGETLGEILIAYAGNEKAQDKRMKLEKAYRNRNPKYKNPSTEIPSKDLMKISKETMIGTVALDFRGFTENGVEVPNRHADGTLHEENLRRLLEFRSIWLAVAAIAAERESFAEESLEETLGN